MGGRGSVSKFNNGNSGSGRPQTLADYLGPQGSPKDYKEAMALANPHFAESVAAKDKLYTHNCQRCIWAVELMRRGYDVEALPRTADDDYAKADSSLPHSYTNVGDPPLKFGQTVGSLFWKPKASEIKDEILRHPEGSRGVLRMHSFGNGHVCNWEIKKGKVIIYDGQTGTTHSASELLKRGYSAFAVARMDNVKITDLAKDFVKRRQP